MNYPDFIEEILLAKSFQQLSQQEKGLIGEWIADEAEYTTLRSLLTGIHTAVNCQEEDAPSEALFINLQKAYNATHPQKKRKALAWKVIAITSIAATVALIAYIAVSYTPNSTAPPLAQNTLPSPQKTDTGIQKKSKAITSEANTPTGALEIYEESNEDEPNSINQISPNVEITEDVYKAAAAAEEEEEQFFYDKKIAQDTVSNDFYFDELEKQSAPEAKKAETLNNFFDKYSTVTSAANNTITVAQHADLLQLSVVVY